LLGIKHHQGVYFLEVLVVLVIIAILCLMSIPAFTTFLQTQRLTATTENLYYALQEARSEAIKRNTTVYVVFTSGSSWCYGSNPSSICTCSNASSCTLGTTTANLSQQISLSATGLTNNAVQFESVRGAAGSSSLITFTLNGQTTSMSVSITGLGNMKICSSSVSGFPTCP